MKRFEKLREMKNEQAVLKEKLDECNASLDFGGSVVDRAHTAELKLCAKNLLEARKNVEAKRADRSSAGDGEYDGELAAIGEKLESVGGVTTIENELVELKKKSKRQGIFAVVSDISVRLNEY